ncbi:ead/Ea22-like family protein [Enterobacter cloacae]|nr:ead/Ea22-like family protein [Enterobacter cloacae]
MNNIDKGALREAADIVIQKYGSEWFETGRQLCTVHKSKIELIAAANPDTVLALLDELEAKDKRLNEILTPNMLLPVIDDMDADNFRHVINTVCENYSLLHAKWETAEKRIAEQREIMRQAASDISYAIFNLTGSDLSRLQPGVIETTDPTDTALIAERSLRAAAAGKGE